MKKIFYIVLMMFGVMSCNVLEENPNSFISPTNFYKTKSDAIAAVSAAYAPLGVNGFVSRNFVILGEITTDNMYPLANNNDRVQLDNYVQTSQNVILRETYQNFLIAITRCNVAINRVPKIDMDADLRDRLVAEAKFLRGFYYFQLVQYFGKLPLITTETETLDQVTYPERSEVSAIYAQIIEDLKAAEEVLPVTYAAADYSRATKGAAKAFLAKVYLTR